MRRALILFCAAATAYVPPALVRRRRPVRPFAPPSSLAEAEASAPPKDQAEWEAVVAALEAYKKVHGDVRVPTRFAVPDDEEYPEVCRGLKLGQRVASIRATGRYVDDEGRRRQLEALGFEWRLRRPSASQGGANPPEPFEVVVAALEAYRAAHGDAVVPPNFVVPRNDPWPAACRGLPLGARIESLADPDHAYFEGAPPGVAEEREAALAALGVVVKRAGARQSTARRFEIVYSALSCFKEINGHLNVQQTFVVPDEDPWPEAARSMKLGSRVNAIRSHGTFLRRHPERRQRLVDLGLSLNEPEPAQNSGGAGSILDAVLKDTGKGTVDAWGLDFSGETAEAEEEERPRVLPVGADFLDEAVLPREDYERFLAEGWRFDIFDGGYDFEDVVDALEEFKLREGHLDVPDDFVVPAEELDDDDDENAPAEVEDLDVALAAFLASSRADADDASLLGDAAASPFPGLADPDAEPTLAELEALEAEGARVGDGVVVGDAVSPRDAPWPENCRGLQLGAACDALRCGDASGREDLEKKAALDALGFDWGDPDVYVFGLRWHQFLGCIFSFSKIKGSLNVGWDFVVPHEDPWPAPYWGAPLGTWANEVRRQEPTFRRHFPERKRHLGLMGFRWLPAVFAAPAVAVDERLPPCLRLDPDDLDAPFRKKKRKKKAAPKKGKAAPPPLPTAGDVDVDYARYTVKVLKDLLRERDLKVSGKRKADYVERLANDDLERQAEAAAAAAAAAPTAAADDDDDDLDDEEDEEEDDDDDLDDEEEELDVVDALSDALASGPDLEETSPDDEL